MQFPKRFIVNRDIEPDELSWLPDGIQRDTIVYKCLKFDYGCVSNTGMGVTFDKTGGYPLFELPREALT